MINLVIFSSLIGILFILYLIGYFKNINFLQKLSLPFILPCAVGIVIPILLEQMPDSFHILIFSSIAISIPILQVWIEPIKVKGIEVFKYFLFTLSNAAWIYLFYSIFYIYSYSTIITIIAVIIYLASIIFCTINFGIKTLKQIISLILLLMFCFFLNFISIVSLVYLRTLHTFFLFAGTTLLIGFAFTSLSTRFKSLVTNSKLILNMLFVIGEICIYASCVLMIL